MRHPARHPPPHVHTVVMRPQSLEWIRVLFVFSLLLRTSPQKTMRIAPLRAVIGPASRRFRGPALQRFISGCTPYCQWFASPPCSFDTVGGGGAGLHWS